MIERYEKIVIYNFIECAVVIVIKWIDMIVLNILFSPIDDIKNFFGGDKEIKNIGKKFLFKVQTCLTEIFLK